MRKGEKMNLIDKDLLLVELQKMQEKGSKETRGMEGDGGYCLGLEDAIMAAEDAVIVEERKHGHWVKEYGEHLKIKCSECEYKANYFWNDWQNVKYCPNCGAIMDEKVRK